MNLEKFHTEKTMTSLQIAEITGKPHYDLMKSIRKMEESWVNIGQGKFSLTHYMDQFNRKQPMYELTKKECLYIATKFNDEARAKLIIRWEELEKQRQNIDFSDPDTVLMLAQNWKQEQQKRLLAEQRIKLQQNVIKEQAPKVAYYDDVLISKATYVTTQIAKELGMSGMRLNQELKALNIQYKINGQWILYSKFQNKGLTKTKTATFVDAYGEIKTSMHTVWTEKGRKFIHQIFKQA